MAAMSPFEQTNYYIRQASRTMELGDRVERLLLTPEGEHHPGTKVRKNPGHMLLSRVVPDPCRENRPYLIEILKLGNRILFHVDGILIHDVRDKGGFGSAYDEGKIGFWVHGQGGTFKSTFDNIRKAAEVKPSERGGRGQQRRYSSKELLRLISAVEKGSFRNGPEIAACWRQLLAQ